MAARSNTIAALDIGTSQIKMVIVQVEASSKPHLLAGASCVSTGLRKGVVINIDSTVQSISKVVEEAEKMAGAQVSNVYASLSGAHIKGFNSHGVVGVRGREVGTYDIERVIEAARAVAIPADREILHVLPQEFVVDGQDGIKEPLGISGVRLEARAHIITGAVASAQNIVKCANRCGLGVKDIVLSPIASALATLSPEERELGVCLVDIGGGTTDILVFQGGSVRHSSVLPVGGAHITNDIAAGLRTPLSAAEQMKCSSARAYPQGIDPFETLQVSSTGGRPPRVVSRVALAEIVEPRIAEIFTLVRRELEVSGALEMLTGGVVLTGGTSNLPGITEVAEDVLESPVRVAAPHGFSGLTELVAHPEFSTACGLILYTSQARTLRNFADNAQGVRKIARSVRRWVSEHL